MGLVPPAHAVAVHSADATVDAQQDLRSRTRTAPPLRRTLASGDGTVEWATGRRCLIM